jgi:hypothetical protein
LTFNNEFPSSSTFVGHDVVRLIFGRILRCSQLHPVVEGETGINVCQKRLIELKTDMVYIDAVSYQRS